MSINGFRRRIFLILVGCSLSSAPLFAAEVYYLGQPASPEAQEASKERDLSFKKRVKDLLDFGAFGEYKPDRTGQISGSFLGEIDYNQISGNTANSFYRRGAEYLTEASVNAWEQLWRDYKAESRVTVRKTDNPQYETIYGLRLKELNVRVSNPDNLLEFGDLYADFTNFTLGSTLEGFRGDFNPLPNAKVQPRAQFVAARKNEEDVWAGQYQRNVFGGKFDVTSLKDQWILSNVRLGSQCVTSQDDRATAWHVTPSGTQVQDLSDTVFGLDGDVNFKKYLGFRWEWARSAYARDTSALVNQTEFGNALKLEPAITSKYVNFRYLYYYVQPSFYTEVGSASNDKVQHQFTLDLMPVDRVRISFIENYYWNHLARSFQPYRTTNDEKYATLYLRPWVGRENFDVRLYANYLSQDSDNHPVDTVETDTTTTGFSVNDRIWDAYVGARYEYRGYRDDRDKGRDDYFNRMGYNVSRDFQLFKRRLFLSGDFTFDFHDPQSEDDNEVTTGISLTGQYDLAEWLALRGGMNVQDFTAAAPDSGYLNTRSYGELDFLLNKKRGTHLIGRIERNVYDNVDGNQDYKELRAVTKFTSQF